MSTFAPPMALGDTVLSASPSAAGLICDLGNEYSIGKWTVRLCRATTADTVPASRAKIGVITAGVRTGYVDIAAAANSYLVAGICASNQAAFAVGDFFLLITGGQSVPAITDDTSAVVGDAMGVSAAGSLGKIQGLATATTLASTIDQRTYSWRVGILEKIATAATATVYVHIDRRL